MHCAAWRAPETLEHREDGRQVVSALTDMYMFGCFMLEVLVGKTPWWWLSSSEHVLLARGANPSLSPLDAARARTDFKLVVSKSRASSCRGCVDDIVALAQSCLLADPSARPDVTAVLRVLHGLRDEQSEYDCGTTLVSRHLQPEVGMRDGFLQFECLSMACEDAEARVRVQAMIAYTDLKQIVYVLQLMEATYEHAATVAALQDEVRLTRHAAEGDADALCKEMLAALKAAEDEGKRRAELERRAAELTTAVRGVVHVLTKRNIC